MIIVQTPLRISFMGGGTDLPQFFQQEEGMVVSSAINRYVFVIIKQRYDRMIRVGYSCTELVENIDQLRHELVRESLRKTGILNRVEISTMADVPSSGSGMGSSSAVTVGLLNAMYHYQGEPKDREHLAREACGIEIDTLEKPIGRQDQYIASYGGQRVIRFCPSGKVHVDSLRINPEDLEALSGNLMLFYTNIARQAESVLAEQVCNITRCRPLLREMKALAYQAKDALETGQLDEFGLLLHQAWEIKKTFSTQISNPSIDGMYDAARRAGALGGKIAGAGGGGFLLLYCPRDRQASVRKALGGFQELQFGLERDGTKVIFNYPE